MRRRCPRPTALMSALAAALTATATTTAAVAPAAWAASSSVAASSVAAGLPAAATAGTPLPGGRPHYVVSVLGGSFNHYWARLAEYTFTPGSGGRGIVRQSYWMWHQAHFDGNAAVNKVSTGYTTAGCAANCTVRTPRGFQPKAGPMSNLVGRYRYDRFQRLVIEWPGRKIEVWSMINSSPTLTRLQLHHTSLGGLAGDGFGSAASFAAGATRDQVAGTELTGVQRVASYDAGGVPPVKTSRWSTNVIAPMQRCPGAGAACLFYTGPNWRSAIVVPRGLGRRAYWQHQLQGSDGQRGACFGRGGGHTVALLQIIDDRGVFAGFVGAEASFNGRSLRNAVIGEVVLT